LEEFKKLWIRARSEEEGAEVGAVSDNTYREGLSPHLAAALNLFRRFCANKEEGKAKSFLTSKIGDRAETEIDLVIELYDRFYYKDADISARYNPVIQRFAESGNPGELEVAKSAHALARRCLDQGIVYRALIFAQRATLLNPTWYGHYSIHAEVLIALGLYTEAEKVAIIAYELEPSPTLFTYSPLADLLKLNRNYKRLEQLAKESYENSGGPSGGESIAYAECLMLCGKAEEAIAILKQGLAASEEEKWEHAELLLCTARALCQQGSYASAESLLRSDELYAKDERLQLEYANVLARGGKMDEAFEILKVIHKVPTER
jgi:tetratricopeptide (TPR) repeat protein